MNLTNAPCAQQEIEEMLLYPLAHFNPFQLMLLYDKD